MQRMSVQSRYVNVPHELHAGAVTHELMIAQAKSDVTASTLFIKEEISVLRDDASHSTMFANAAGKRLVSAYTLQQVD